MPVTVDDRFSEGGYKLEPFVRAINDLVLNDGPVFAKWTIKKETTDPDITPAVRARCRKIAKWLGNNHEDKDFSKVIEDNCNMIGRWTKEGTLAPWLHYLYDSDKSFTGFTMPSEYELAQLSGRKKPEPVVIGNVTAAPQLGPQQHSTAEKGHTGAADTPASSQKAALTRKILKPKSKLGSQSGNSVSTAHFGQLPADGGLQTASNGVSRDLDPTEVEIRKLRDEAIVTLKPHVEELNARLWAAGPQYTPWMFVFSVAPTKTMALIDSIRKDVSEKSPGDLEAFRNRIEGFKKDLERCLEKKSYWVWCSYLHEMLPGTFKIKPFGTEYAMQMDSLQLLPENLPAISPPPSDFSDEDDIEESDEDDIGESDEDDIVESDEDGDQDEIDDGDGSEVDEDEDNIDETDVNQETDCKYRLQDSGVNVASQVRNGPSIDRSYFDNLRGYSAISTSNFPQNMNKRSGEQRSDGLHTLQQNDDQRAIVHQATDTQRPVDLQEHDHMEGVVNNKTALPAEPVQPQEPFSDCFRSDVNTAGYSAIQQPLLGLSSGSTAPSLFRPGRFNPFVDNAPPASSHSPPVPATVDSDMLEATIEIKQQTPDLDPSEEMELDNQNAIPTPTEVQKLLISTVQQPARFSDYSATLNNEASSVTFQPFFSQVQAPLPSSFRNETAIEIPKVPASGTNFSPVSRSVASQASDELAMASQYVQKETSAPLTSSVEAEMEDAKNLPWTLPSKDVSKEETTTSSPAVSAKLGDELLSANHEAKDAISTAPLVAAQPAIPALGQGFKFDISGLKGLSERRQKPHENEISIIKPVLTELKVPNSLNPALLSSYREEAMKRHEEIRARQEMERVKAEQANTAEDSVVQPSPSDGNSGDGLDVPSTAEGPTQPINIQGQSDGISNDELLAWDNAGIVPTDSEYDGSDSEDWIDAGSETFSQIKAPTAEGTGSRTQASLDELSADQTEAQHVDFGQANGDTESHSESIPTATMAPATGSGPSQFELLMTTAFKAMQAEINSIKQQQKEQKSVNDERMLQLDKRVIELEQNNVTLNEENDALKQKVALLEKAQELTEDQPAPANVALDTVSSKPVAETVKRLEPKEQPSAPKPAPVSNAAPGTVIGTLGDEIEELIRSRRTITVLDTWDLLVLAQDRLGIEAEGESALTHNTDERASVKDEVHTVDIIEPVPTEQPKFPIEAEEKSAPTNSTHEPASVEEGIATVVKPKPTEAAEPKIDGLSAMHAPEPFEEMTTRPSSEPEPHNTPLPDIERRRPAQINSTRPIIPAKVEANLASHNPRELKNLEDFITLRNNLTSRNFQYLIEGELHATNLADNKITTTADAIITVVDYIDMLKHHPSEYTSALPEAFQQKLATLCYSHFENDRWKSSKTVCNLAKWIKYIKKASKAGEKVYEHILAPKSHLTSRIKTYRMHMERMNYYRQQADMTENSTEPYDPATIASYDAKADFHAKECEKIRTEVCWAPSTLKFAERARRQYGEAVFELLQSELVTGDLERAMEETLEKQWREMRTMMEDAFAEFAIPRMFDMDEQKELARVVGDHVCPDKDEEF